MEKAYMTDNPALIKWLTLLPAEVHFDLQMFAAEDEGRTEDPSERRLREAREKGQVAKSAELPQALTIIFTLMIIYVMGVWIYNYMGKMTIYYLTSFHSFRMTETSVVHELLKMIDISARVLLPIMGVAFVAAFLGNVVQVGLRFSAEPLKFDISKLKFDPATIMKKIFFSKQIAFNLFKSIFKVVVIGFTCYLIISNSFDSLLKIADVPLIEALSITSKLAFKIILWAAILLLIMALPDYFFQRREFMESLKMTKQEVKEEYKQDFGDPQVKSRLKQMQEDILNKNMIREVPKADVVVTNPTHFAVALRYDRETMAAPQVIAKGVDSMALKIREIARENGVLMIENRPLAHELYYSLDVGDIIPENLFQAISIIYAEVYRHKNLRRAI